MSNSVFSSLQDPYKPTTLSHYSWHKRLMINICAVATYVILQVIGLTLRWEKTPNTNNNPTNKRGSVPENTPIIYVFWHNRILGATLFFKNRKIVVMTSQSYDGEIIARVIQMFGYGASRGSTTRGGIKALKEMVRYMNQGIDTALTIDGPKGPMYLAKSGAVILAHLTGAPILPMCINTKNYLELNSWDKFRIPYPFSKAQTIYAPPIYVSKSADDKEMQLKQLELQKALDSLHQESILWTKKI